MPNKITTSSGSSTRTFSLENRKGHFANSWSRYLDN